MTEIKHKLWDIGKIAFGATVGYFFRAYRDKEEYKRARIGIFKGSALIFATYMTFSNIVPTCTRIGEKLIDKDTEIKKLELQQQFHKDTIDAKRKSKDLESMTVFDQYQQKFSHKVDSTLERYHKSLEKEIRPVIGNQEELKKGIYSLDSKFATKLETIDQKISRTPQIKYIPTPTTPSTQSTERPLYTASNTYLQRLPAIQKVINYYEVVLDKSEGEAIFNTIFNDGSRERIGTYAASQPQNETPDGTYQSYKVMRLSNDRYPGYIFFNKNNSNCGIAGAGPDGAHNDEITQRLIANINGWRVGNAEFETIYAKASTNKLIVRVQE